MNTRLLKRFARVALWTGAAAPVAHASMSWPWSILVQSILAGIAAIIDKYLRERLPK